MALKTAWCIFLNNLLSAAEKENKIRDETRNGLSRPAKRKIVENHRHVFSVSAHFSRGNDEYAKTSRPNSLVTQ